MIEHERSYIFTHEGAHEFLEKQGYPTRLNPEDRANVGDLWIEDSYLGKGMRVRKSWIDPGREQLSPSSVSYVFTRKTGEKANGYRFEFEENISDTLAKNVIIDTAMRVKKRRCKIPVSEEYTVTMDFVEEPMKIAVLEIEALSEVVFPIPIDITQKLFGVDLKECPLCTYTLFNRHIGIAGGPSSGKSETAKILSHVINTEYSGNSFHVAEFATTFIQKYKKNPSFWEEFFIWHGQHEREHSADLANIVISDCPTFLTYIYLVHLPKDEFSDSTALVLAKMYKRVLFDIKWYSDLIFLNLLNYKENHIRYQSKKEAEVIETRIVQFLDDHNISYSIYDYTQKDDMLKDLFYINE